MAAEDKWGSTLFECSWGGVRLDVQSTSDAGGRALFTARRPHRNAHPVRDMGGEPRVSRCRIVFWPVDATDDPLERFYFFKALVDNGDTRTFVHPISGRFRAKVGELSWSADSEERDTITVECSFHEDDDEPAVFEAGAGAPVSTGVEEVSAAAADVNLALADFNAEQLAADEDWEALETTVTTEAVELAEEWEAGADALSQREVALDLVAISNKIQEETDRLELATNLDRHPIMVALSDLHAQLRNAADAVFVESPRLIEITVTAPMSLWMLCSETYGADQAEDRVEQIIRLNDILNPARLEAGTRLKAYAATSSSQLRTPARPGL